MIPCAVWTKSFPVTVFKSWSKLSNSEWNAYFESGSLMICVDRRLDVCSIGLASAVSHSTIKEDFSRWNILFNRVISCSLLNRWLSVIPINKCLPNFHSPFVAAQQMSRAIEEIRREVFGDDCSECLFKTWLKKVSNSGGISVLAARSEAHGDHLIGSAFVTLDLLMQIITCLTHYVSCS